MTTIDVYIRLFDRGWGLVTQTLKGFSAVSKAVFATEFLNIYKVDMPQHRSNFAIYSFSNHVAKLRRAKFPALLIILLRFIKIGILPELRENYWLN